MSVQACEGVFRQKCGRYVAVIPCERREGGQLWTDGIIHYFNDGTVTFAEGGSVVDLVEYIGPLPDSSQGDQAAEIDRLRAELQQTQVWRTAATDAHLQSEVQRTEMQAENERLQSEWQTEFTAAQQLRSEVQQLEGLNCKLSEIARDLQEHHTAMDHRAEGARLAFLDVIKTLLEMRR